MATICVLTMALLPATGSAADWTSAGHGAYDNRVQPFEFKINVLNAPRLKPKGVFTTHGSESATPVVSGGIVYFPDFGGYMNAVNASTGALVWQEPISNYDGVAGSFSRDSPVIDGNELIFGDSVSGAHSQGAHLIAVNAQTGALLWSTQLDSSPAAIVTGSPVVAGGKLLVGVSSNEETEAATDTYSCCTFRGSVVALNPATGAIIWKTYTVPDNGGQPCTTDNPPSGCGYSGGAVWDSPAVDVATNTLYIGSGNNYTAPDAAVAWRTRRWPTRRRTRIAPRRMITSTRCSRSTSAPARSTGATRPRAGTRSRSHASAGRPAPTGARPRKDPTGTSPQDRT